MIYKPEKNLRLAECCENCKHSFYNGVCLCKKNEYIDTMNNIPTLSNYVCGDFEISNEKKY